MSVVTTGDDVQQRLEQLERRLAATIRAVNHNGLRLDVLEGERVRTSAAHDISLSDFLGGRALAWLGGLATLLGIVLLLGLAISHDWIGPAVRVILAGGAWRSSRSLWPRSGGAHTIESPATARSRSSRPRLCMRWRSRRRRPGS